MDTSTFHRIILHTSLIAPSTSKPWGKHKLLGQRLASDVLLHEMIHQYIYEQIGNAGGGTSSHNNSVWVAEINRLIPLLQLQGKACVIRQQRVEGKVTWVQEEGCLARTQLADWPISSRPNAYYEQAAQNLLKKLRGIA